MKSRVLILVTAPIILVAGLGIFWGVRKGSGIVRQVEEWADDLEHSSRPVEIRVAGLPIVSNMYLDGRRVGKLESVLVLRDRPGDIDSVRIVARIEPRYLDGLQECNIEISPEEMEDEFPTEGWKSIMECVSDTSGLAPFGTVIVEGSGHRLPIFLAREHMPCRDWAPMVAIEPPVAPRVEVNVGGASISAEIQAAVDEAMVEAAEAMAEAAEAMEEAREAYEESCVEEGRTRRDLQRLRDQIRREVRRSTRGVRVNVP